MEKHVSLYLNIQPNLLLNHCIGNWAILQSCSLGTHTDCLLCKFEVWGFVMSQSKIFRQESYLFLSARITPSIIIIFSYFQQESYCTSRIWPLNSLNTFGRNHTIHFRQESHYAFRQESVSPVKVYIDIRTIYRFKGTLMYCTTY